MVDNYEFDKEMARHDEADAASLRTDAEGMRTESTHDFAEAGTMLKAGLPDQAVDFAGQGAAMLGNAAGFDARAALLDDAAALEMSSHDHLVDRDEAKHGAESATARAEGAAIVLEFTEDSQLSEQDRTHWIGEQGAATGEAAALSKRADELTNTAISEMHEATADENAAHAGLEGRHWDGLNLPASGPTEPE